MHRIELYCRNDCAEARIVADWLRAGGHAHLWRDLGQARVAEDLRARVRLGIAPVTLVNGRPVWGTGEEQVRRLRRMLRPRGVWTLPWWRG